MEQIRLDADEEMDPIIEEQILAVRDTGETNMFDINAVGQIAMREEFFELVEYLYEHEDEYVEFILHGKKKQETVDKTA